MRTRLDSRRGSVVAVTVEADAAWVGARGRVFPVTIDPSLLDKTTTFAGGIDTTVNANNPTTRWDTDAFAYLGATTAGDQWETLLKFSLTDPLGLPVTGPDVYVSEAHVSVNEQTPPAWSCDDPGTAVALTGVSTAWTSAVTWNTRPLTAFTSPTVRGFGGCGRGWMDVDATEAAAGWMNESQPNFGVRLFKYSPLNPGFEVFHTSDLSGADAPKLHITYTRVPSPTVPLTPADKEIVGTTTPTLVLDPANLSVDPDGDTVKYWYRVSSPLSVVANSGWTTATSWPVPPGILEGGIPYEWRVMRSDDTFFETTFNYFNGSISGGGTWSRVFSVDSQLGADERRPADTVGPVRVNLTNGNATLAVGSPTIPTAGGGIGVSFAYNSAVASTGLTGTYSFATPGHGLIYPAGFVRRDPSVDFDWGTASPGAPLGADAFRVTWEGTVTVPVAGNYEFGADSDDGVRIYINGALKLNRWVVQSAGTPQYGTSVSLAAQESASIKIEYFEDTGTAQFHPWVRVNGTPMPVPVPWFSPSDPSFATPLPVGWTFSPGAGALDYVSLWKNDDDSVTLEGPDGYTALFLWTGSGFVPAEGDSGTLSKTNDGGFTFSSPSGATYTFDEYGFLRSATAAIDDLNRAAPRYSYEGIEAALTKISDPASPRFAVLTYQNVVTGQTCPTLAGFDAPPTGGLCKVTYFDKPVTPVGADVGGAPSGGGYAVAARLHYKAGQLARIEQPGGATTDFGYVGNQLVEVRDPLTFDAVAAGVRTDDTTTRIQIAYSGNRVSGVTLPAPTAGAARPAHTYAYSPNETIVHVAGLVEANGFARKAAYDPRGRTLTDTDALGRATTTSWDVKGRPVAAVDAAGLQSTMFYDAADNVVETYGPAPVSWFNAPPDPAAYRPTTLHAADVPHTTTAYDKQTNNQDLAGLATAWYSTPDLTGDTKAHALVPATNAWASGSPATGVAVDNFSGRLTGQATIGSGGSTLSVNTSPTNLETSGARLWADDEEILNTVPSTFRGSVKADRPAAWWRLGDAVGSTTAVDAMGTASGTYVGAVTRDRSDPTRSTPTVRSPTQPAVGSPLSITTSSTSRRTSPSKRGCGPRSPANIT